MPTSSDLEQALPNIGQLTAVDASRFGPPAPGTGMAWVGAWMLEIIPQQAAQPQVRVSIWAQEPGVGTPMLWARDSTLSWGYLGAQRPTAFSPDALSVRWVRRLLSDPSLARELPGVFGLFVIDAIANEVLVCGDRLGVQAIHYARRPDGGLAISTNLMWVLQTLDHEGGVEDAAVLTHLGLGYPVAPDTSIYSGVNKLPASGYVRVKAGSATAGRYATDDPVDGAAACDVEGIAGALSAATNVTDDLVRPCFGLTSGKDSLCLASVVHREAMPLSATFGAAQSADRRQGLRLSATLGWPHVSDNLCQTDEFRRWASHVAFYSAGLATASYADMASFVDRSVPVGHGLVMGEGGECVRDFFAPRNETAILRERYTTPVDYLRQTLAVRFAPALVGYPDALIARTSRDAVAGAPDPLGLWFYRSQRMPGNFSLRHAVLAPLRAKISPFLDGRFVHRAYGVDPSWYAASTLHRAVIERARPDLLPFFDRPDHGSIETQDWPRRFSSALGSIVARLLDDTLPLCGDIFNADGVRELCRATIAHPSRAIYHLLRILSFSLARAELRRTPVLQERGRPAATVLHASVPAGATPRLA